MKIYQDIDGGPVYDSLDAFVSARLLNRKGNGIFPDTALQYPWHIMDSDGILSNRAPSLKEVEDFEALVWSARKRGSLTCPQQCSKRFQFNDEHIWRCAACKSVWTRQTHDGRCYGQEISENDLTEKITEIVNAIPVMVGVKAGLHEAFTQAIKENGLRVARKHHINKFPLGNFNNAIVDVRQEGFDDIFFCVVTGSENASPSLQWETSPHSYIFS